MFTSAFQLNLTNLDHLEFSYHDETMMELRLNPADVELTIPKFLRAERKQLANYWRNQLQIVTEKMEQAEAEARKTHQ